MAERRVDFDVDRAFGAENRARLLDIYFLSVASEPVSAESAWRHTYRLLMWIDRTIGLAHCYESDKCQPGRPWYARSLRFHQWLAGELGASARGLADEIDWLFTAAAEDLARAANTRAITLQERARGQRELYARDNMPLPGEDLELEALIKDTLVSGLGEVPPMELIRLLSQRIQAYRSSENKRKNLVGEGFEDTLAVLFRRLPAIEANYEILVRPALHELPGFNPPRGGEKTRKVDLALVQRQDRRRVLVSCKWSVRSDREEQFATDFDTYARLEASGRSFDYVLVTNEFDPARLAAACDMRRLNQAIFSDVVHVNPRGPRVVYETSVSAAAQRQNSGVTRALDYIDSGRIASLEAWLSRLGARVDP
ncbi:hypothetical protein [Mycolicibacterium sp. 050158]|uniref:hypothetical protein n=1 Tax=Mycolicibacterium sp. 050158 TaxID=3090602 RepID=UPI00299E3F94|nr:hypothetical protein [Mycolicibacterium sp. 050158]MDX1893279.1 hypothetical protein [Mycolicibacterium sp. 050158]